MNSPESDSPPGPAWSVLLPLGLLEAALLALLGWWDGATVPWAASTLFLAAFAAYAVAAGQVLKRTRALLGFTLAVAVTLLPYVTAGNGVLTGVADRLQSPPFMAGPYALLESIAVSSVVGRSLAVLFVLGVAVWATLNRYRPERALFWVLGAAVLVTPELRPEYVLWMLPLAALRVSRPWILMTGLAFLCYAGLPTSTDTSWTEPLWARLTIWVPVLLLLAHEGAVLWRTRVPPAPLP